MSKSAERPLTPGASRAALAAGLRVAAWGMAIYAATRGAAMLLDARSMASLVAQAVIVEMGLGRLGVAWSDPLAPLPDGGVIARRALRGAAVGLVVAMGIVVFLWSTRAILVTSAQPAWASIAVALVGAGLVAMRDELLLHGLTMRALITVAPPLPRILACGVTSAAFTYGDGGGPYATATQGILGLVFGALWARDRGAWQAWGAHTAWLFGTAMLLDGGLLDARPATNAWGGGNAGALGGAAAVVAALPFGFAALWLTVRARAVTKAP